MNDINNKAKVNGLRRGITVAALAAMSMQTGVDKAQAEIQFQQKEPEKKEIIVEKPVNNPIPADTIAPFGSIPQEEVKPDTLSQTLPEEKINPIVKPVVEEEKALESFEYIDECVDFVDQYEEIEKAKKEGKLSPEEQKEARDWLYTQAYSLTVLETADNMFNVVKPLNDFMSNAAELAEKSQQYPQGSKEHDDIMKQIQQTAKQAKKEIKKPVAEILGGQSELIEDANNNIRVLNGNAGKDEDKIKDDFIKKNYKKSLDYLKENAPEIIQERNSEKAIAKKVQRRDKLEERADNGNPFAKLILKVKERNEDKKDAKSPNLSDFQKYQQMKGGKNL